MWNEFGISVPVPVSVSMMDGRSYGIDVLTADEVAALMRVSKMTVYRKIHSGELPSVHFGRSYRVPAMAIEAYLPRYDATPAPDEDRP